MSDTVNPYKSPEAGIVPEKPLAAHGPLTETMLFCLKQASPWLRFVGVLGFISAGFTVLSGVFLVAFIPLTRQLWSDVPGFESLSSAMGWGFGGSLALYCIAVGALMFFPSLFAYRFGEKIRSYLRTGMEQDLESAFKNNKNLWKFIGILCIISLAFIPLLIIGSIILVLAAVLSQ